MRFFSPFVITTITLLAIRVVVKALKHIVEAESYNRFIFAEIYYTYHTYDFNAAYGSFGAFAQHNVLLDVNLNMKLAATRLSMQSHLSLRNRKPSSFWKI